MTAGRMADPDRADEFVVTSQAARLLGWHIGKVIPMGFYTNAQRNEPAFGTARVKPRLRLDMELAGTVVFNNEVVLDEVDRFPAFALFTPALTGPFSAGMQYAVYGLKLSAGARGIPAVEREIIEALPRGTTYRFHVTSVVEGQVDRTVKPDAIALAVFGVIALLAALLIAMQMIARQLSGADEDLEVLRALGVSRAIVMGDGLVGVLGAVVLGSLLAVGVAIGLSPLSPIGPVRPVYPAPGIAVDVAVLGFGLAALIGGIGAAAAALAYRQAPGRVRHEVRTRASWGSSLARAAANSEFAAANSGAPVSAVAGVRFAIEPGHGRTAVPVRSAMFGTALAVLIVVATLTFGSGLSTLVSHPALYGWNWNYALGSGSAASASSAAGHVPPQALFLLGHDRAIAASSGVSFSDVQIDGQTVPVILASTCASRPADAVRAPARSGQPDRPRRRDARPAAQARR